MRNLYMANGFLDAKVEPNTLDDYKGKRGDLAIHFKIEEGKQTRVASLTMEGVHAFKEDELMGEVASTPGQPYSDFNVATDRDVLLALYFNEGFPEASFTSTADRINGSDTNGAATEENTADRSQAGKENGEERETG